MLDHDELKQLIKETLVQVEESNHRWSFSWPVTFRGWVMAIGGVAAAISFVWTTVVYLHRISEHHKAPHHDGAEVLVQRIEDALITHANNDEHHTEAELQLKILHQTEPIKRDIQRIQQDVGSIKTKVDILIDREDRK